jgi:hypothetical protein
MLKYKTDETNKSTLWGETLGTMENQRRLQQQTIGNPIE